MDFVRDVVRGFKAEVGARIIYFATTGVVLVFLARQLTPDGYGLVFLALSVLAVGQLLADLGIPRSAARYIAEYEELDPDQVGFIVTFSFSVILLSATTVMIIVVVLHREIAALFDEPALGTPLLVGAALILCRALYRYFRRVLQGFKHIGSSASVYSMEGVGRLVSVVGFVLLGFGTAGAIGGYAFGFGSAALLGAVLFYRRIYPTLDVTLNGDPELQSRILRYAMPLLGIKSARVVDNSFDTMLVGFFLAPAAVGFYSLSRQAVHLLQAPASALGFTAGPWFGDQKAAGNVDDIADIYRSSLVYTLLFYLPVAAGLALLARPALLLVFGESYLPATNVLQILSGLAVLQAVEELSENAIDYLGRARERSATKAITVVASFLAMVVLIPVFGIEGAAIAKVATHGVYVGTLLFIMRLEVGLDLREVGRNAAQIIVVTALMSVSVLQAAKYISGLVTFAAVVLLGGTIWAVLAVALGFVDAETVRSVLG
jgi:O-antigen/teichoic acid export membrane protein